MNYLCYFISKEKGWRCPYSGWVFKRLKQYQFFTLWVQYWVKVPIFRLHFKVIHAL